jgi:hypothetical protein
MLGKKRERERERNFITSFNRVIIKMWLRFRSEESDVFSQKCFLNWWNKFRRKNLTLLKMTHTRERERDLGRKMKKEKKSQSEMKFNWRMVKSRDATRSPIVFGSIIKSETRKSFHWKVFFSFILSRKLSQTFQSYFGIGFP